MEIDKRKYNDNSRKWHNEMIEKRKEALSETCKLILNKCAPRTLAHVSRIMNSKYDKHIALTAQTIRQNPIYHNIFTSILKEDTNDISNVKANNKSYVELNHELHTEKTKNKELRNEVNLLRHQIKQSNIDTSTKEYTINNTFNLELYSLIITSLIKELIRYGDFYISKDGLVREFDGTIFITKDRLNDLKIDLKEMQ